MSELELDEAPFQALEAPETSALRVLTNQVLTDISGTFNRISGVRKGTLIGVTDDGRTPLVVYPGQPGSAAIAARSTIDLHGAHVGRELILMFEDGNPLQPIVLGCLRPADDKLTAEQPGQFTVDVDGERLLVTAKEQMVLRCGKASITLTKAGKVLIEGAYLSSRSTGVIRIKGGSVQLN